MNIAIDAGMALKKKVSLLGNFVSCHLDGWHFTSLKFGLQIHHIFMWSNIWGMCWTNNSDPWRPQFTTCKALLLTSWFQRSFGVHVLMGQRFSDGLRSTRQVLLNVVADREYLKYQLCSQSGNSCQSWTISYESVLLWGKNCGQNSLFFLLHRSSSKSLIKYSFAPCH